MDDLERCKNCDNIISKSMDICPNCGSIITGKINRSGCNEHGSFKRVKSIECLDRMESVLVHLEEELDAILCKKR